jgi:error-prone DNA polymerase
LEETGARYYAVRLGFCMVRSLKQTDAEQLVDRRTYDRIAATRAEKTFTSIEDVWRRAGVPMAALYHMAAADGFYGLGLSRRDAARAIKGLRDEALPLFAAADDRAGILRPEALEPRVTLAPMSDGREVVEDYSSTGLSLRAHPLAFLRKTLARQGFAPCRVVRETPNGLRLSIAGLVLVRQMPGSAKGVMFITLEDESANANLIVWPSVFEQHRRAILGATMLGCWGRVQSADGVIHLIVDRVSDLSSQLKTVCDVEDGFLLCAERGDEAKHGGSGLDSRERKPRDMYEPDLHIDTLKMRARNFR